MSNGICCYIDILGFKYFIREDRQGAIALLQNYQVNLEQDNRLHSEDPYLTPYRRNSFKYFIPFSDSIFIYSENPSDFVLQLADFVYSSFSFTSDAFSNPENLLHPENVTEKGMEIIDGKVISKDYPAKWYPLLFRGGIGFGDARTYELNSITNNKFSKSPCIFGNSVIEAVGFEQSGIKGPRILCGESFYNQLSLVAKKIVHPAFDHSGSYEVNWTAIRYIMSDDLNDWFVDQLLLNNFYIGLLIPAANLWKAYNHLPIALHYYNFLKMIVIGVQHFFDETPYFEKSNSYIKECLQKVELTNKIEDLIK